MFTLTYVYYANPCSSTLTCNQLFVLWPSCICMQLIKLNVLANRYLLWYLITLHCNSILLFLYMHCIYRFVAMTDPSRMFTVRSSDFINFTYRWPQQETLNYSCRRWQNLTDEAEATQLARLNQHHAVAFQCVKLQWSWQLKGSWFQFQVTASLFKRRNSGQLTDMVQHALG